MPPSATDSFQARAEPKQTTAVLKKQIPLDDGTKVDGELPKLEVNHKAPLRLSGALDRFETFDVTPVIGREFVDVDLAEWVRAPNSDELLRDLAITVSERGVVFFRRQDNVDEALQKELVQRLGELTGKPATSRLHIHPLNNASRVHGHQDNEISAISSRQKKALFQDRFAGGGFSSKRQSGRHEWHSDITFEPVPSDYALLRIQELPQTGGDTLWASGYELYDRISPTLRRRLLDGLTAYYAQPDFAESARRNGFELFAGERGAPDNFGAVLEAIHPVVRTNPVTGWRSVFAVGHHVQRIHGLAEDESRRLLDWFNQLIVENHDLQVRLRWQHPNDIAIWDNRSVYHAATPDYLYEHGLGERSGSRSVSLGEKPYFDPQSTSRREALQQLLLHEHDS